MKDKQTLLDVDNLSVDFDLRNSRINAIESVCLKIHAGETLAIVGESGSGKSVTSLAIMGLIRKPGFIRSGTVGFKGEDLLALSAKQRRRYLGRDITMIFQEPAVSLNPSFTIGQQISEVLKLHNRMSRAERHQRTLELLNEVGIADPENCLKSWPHQLSGGMNQRIMIAMAISCNPSMLIADEPTTALDMTVQAQILALLNRLQKKNNMGMIFITHDLSVVSSIAQRVVVMYAGQIVESCNVDELFQYPMHPYSEALLKSVPAFHHSRRERLHSIKGAPPAAEVRLKGCQFHTRCSYASEKCVQQAPDLMPVPYRESRAVRCFHPLPDTMSSSAENS